MSCSVKPDFRENIYINDELFVGVSVDSFADLVQRFMGEEAAEFYRDFIGSLSEACTGECDRVYRVEEHYERVIRDTLGGLKNVKAEKESAQHLRAAIACLRAELL